jgi:hypothetical protein
MLSYLQPSNESDGSCRRSPRTKKMSCNTKMGQPTNEAQDKDIVPMKKGGSQKTKHQKSKHEKKASHYKRKNACNTHQSCVCGVEQKWTEADDKIILRTITEYKKQAEDKSKVSCWAQLAGRFGTPVKQVRD